MELAELIRLAKPRTYTHNFADKHDTHVGTAVKVIKAIRSRPVPSRWVDEVWRGFDWRWTAKNCFGCIRHRILECSSGCAMTTDMRRKTL